MRTYRLYKSPTGEVVRVKQGFSWRAFFFGSFLSSVRRLWMVASVGGLWYVSSNYFNGVPTPTSRTVGVMLALLGFYAIYMLFCGLFGNRWLSDRLRRRGFTMIGEERG